MPMTSITSSATDVQARQNEPPQSEEAQIQERIATLRIVLLLVIAVCLGCLGSLSLQRIFPF